MTKAKEFGPLTVYRLARARSSQFGNPRFMIHTSLGVFRTGVDSSFAYGIENPYEHGAPANRHSSMGVPRHDGRYMRDDPNNHPDSYYFNASDHPSWGVDPEGQLRVPEIYLIGDDQSQIFNWRLA